MKGSIMEENTVDTICMVKRGAFARALKAGLITAGEAHLAVVRVEFRTSLGLTVVSTDGKRLNLVTVRQAAVNEALREVTAHVLTASCKRLVQFLGTKASESEQWVRVSATDSELTVKLYNNEAFSAKLDDSPSFPEYARVIPNEKRDAGSEPVGFTAKFLGDAAKSATAIGADFIKALPSPAREPQLFKAEAGDLELLHVLMPARA